jgi:hypothetical protein
MQPREMALEVIELDPEEAIGDLCVVSQIR